MADPFFHEKARQSRSQRTHLSFQFRTPNSEGKLKSYSRAINYVFRTYATDDIIVIAKADMDTMNFKQPSGQSPVQYVQALWT